MSEPIFEQYVDERGNISVRVSQDVTVLTQEEAERAMAKYDQLRTENQRLRELVRNLRRVIPADVVGVVIDASTDHPTYYKFDEVFRELGVEVDG